MSGLKKQDSKQRGKSKSTQRVGQCFVIDSPKRSSSKTLIKPEPIISHKSTSSVGDFPVRMSAQWGSVKGYPGLAQDFSGRSFAYSRSFGPSGWSLRMSSACSLPMMEQTFRRSLKRLPTSGMWDSGGCLILRVSEFPKVVAESSLSEVLDASPPLSCYLTPHQLSDYLARLRRSDSHRRRMDTLPIVFLRTAHHRKLVSVAKISSPPKGAGIRWLSGPECLLSRLS